MTGFVSGMTACAHALLLLQSVHVPDWTPQELQAFHQWTEQVRPRSDRETIERRYQELVNADGLSDLALVYDPANQHRLQISYPDFQSDFATKPSRDGGYGFHVVKRLVLDQGKKVIEVNEHWAEHRKTGGLLRPDEIRYKTRVFEGDRRVAGSEKQYLFDSIRLAWGAAEEDTKVFRRTVYRWDEDAEFNRRLEMRSRVSAPLSCLACHQPRAGYAREFLSKGEARNHEAIVQDSFFAKSYEKMKGYRKYVAYLRRRGMSAAKIQTVRQRLNDPHSTFRLDALVDVLHKARGTIEWVDGDIQLNVTPDETEQGVYRRQNGSWWRDAVAEKIKSERRRYESLPVLP